ncbi:MAG TPA: serpin family protein [Anaerolineales bacterium]|nr:serpin family protein [Anaerolineales bacterium]HNA55702.1 serpin family protein [Anaerolineales bacterium]HNC88127.1 serpin family protein [Anaerolineales bacterium]
MKSITFQIIALCVMLSMILAACTPSVSLSVAESNKSRDKNPQIAEGDLSTLVDGNNAFALDIYNALRSENGNLILSPYSMSLALAMTYAGARGDTESQMAQAMHYQPQAQLHPAFNALDLALEKKPINLDKDQEPLQINIANSVWAEKTMPILPDYLDTIAVNYGAGIHLADFLNKPNEERVAINNWVSAETEDRIKDLLAEGSITPDTRMVLVNAIYFKADWLHKFDANSSYDSTFHLLDGTEATVKMMGENIHDIPYMQGDGYQVVELPYAGETAAMDIILPEEGNFEAFEASFNKDVYDEIVNGLQVVPSARVNLPKFEFTKDFSLSDALIKLGMVNAFDRGLADFSGMTGEKDLFIGDVIHKAFVAVDEEGTEAAAATAVVMEATGAPVQDIIFIADRPFLFVIRDTVNGQILFVGRVLNPAQ